MITATVKQYGIGRSNRDARGRLYSAMRWDRCVCNNAKVADQSLCDRCQLLAEKGWRVIFSA